MLVNRTKITMSQSVTQHYIREEGTVPCQTTSNLLTLAKLVSLFPSLKVQTIDKSVKIPQQDQNTPNYFKN